jgi:hypothetical protein
MTRTGMSRLVQFTAAVALAAAGCQGPSPRSSGLPAPSVGGGTGSGTLSGNLTSYTTGAPVAGATLRLGGSVALSDAAGAFTLTGTPTAGQAVMTAVLPGYVYRGVAFDLSPSRAGLVLDVIPDAAPFSLTFYRQFVRNAAFGAVMEPLRRWTANPNFYFQQLTLDTNLRVPDTILNAIQANFVQSIPELSGGRFTAGTFESGDQARPSADGWVNVVFFQTTPLCGPGAIGCSTVGGNTGTMTIRYDPNMPTASSLNPYNCSSIALAVADHEITHTMGYWHTTDVLVDTLSTTGCPGSGRPEHTRYHANVAYSRPVGNLDPDVDPTTSAQLVASGARSRPVVACDASTFRR